MRLADRYATWFLGFIVLIALALRLYKLGEWSFWIDEIFTLLSTHNFANQSLANQKISTIFIGASLDILGTNEWSARIVPVLFGVALIIVLFFIARKLFNSRIALLTCLFLTLSSWHIYLSQNSRYFTGFMLFYTLALFGFYFSLEENRPFYFVTALIFALVAFLERVYAALLFPALFVYAVLVTWLPIEKPRYLSKKRIMLLILLPAIGYVSYELLNLVSGKSMFLQSFLGNAVGYADWKPQWLVSSTIDALGTPLFCLAVLGGMHLLIQKHKGGLLLVVSAIVPLFTLMVFALFVRMNLHYYGLVALPVLMILAAVGANELYRRTRQGQLRIVLLVLGVMLGLTLREANYENAFYYFSGTMKVSLIIVTFIVIMLLCGSIVFRYKYNWSFRQALSLTFAGSFLLFLLLDLSIGHILYYGYQHGQRHNWRKATAVIQAHNQDGLPVYSTLPQLGYFYLGDVSQPIGDLLSGNHIDLNSTLKQGGAWFIEENGVDQLMGDEFLIWAESHCEMVTNLDVYSAGDVRKMRNYFCEQRILSDDPAPSEGNKVLLKDG